jgi:phenylpropionate dioxygenase-like ring-hydroxylating dioxygenase large terminal subunit
MGRYTDKGLKPLVQTEFALLVPMRHQVYDANQHGALVQRPFVVTMDGRMLQDVGAGAVINDPVLLNDWHVVGLAKDLLEGKTLRARLLGEDLVLWRVGDRIMAWQDLCLHRGTRLSLGEIQGETLMCPYHGWTYNADGQCVRIPAHPEQTPPAKARVQAYRTIERYGWIWVSLGDPQHDIAHFPEWDDAAHRKIFCGPYVFEAYGTRAVENFLDVAHFPYVHEGYLGDRSHTRISDYGVEVDANGITASDIRVWQPDPDGTGVGKEVTYTYKVFRPLNAYFVKTSQGPSFAIYFVVTPIEERHSLGWMCMTMNYGYDIPEEELRTFQDTVTAQDVPIVESQRPERLPLDLQAELHLRADRTSIAYRKWLKDLGLTFGTA